MSLNEEDGRYLAHVRDVALLFQRGEIDLQDAIAEIEAGIAGLRNPVLQRELRVDWAVLEEVYSFAQQGTGSIDTKLRAQLSASIERIIETVRKALPSSPESSDE